MPTKYGTKTEFEDAEDLVNQTNELTTVRDLLDASDTDLEPMLRALPLWASRLLTKVPSEAWEMDFEDLDHRSQKTRNLRLARFGVWEDFYNCKRNTGFFSFDAALSRAGVKKNSLMVYLRNHPECILYVLTPPQDYNVLLTEALDRGWDRVREILELPFMKRNGEVNAPVARTILQAVQLLEERLKGAPVQRHEVRSLSVSAKMGDRDNYPSPDEIDQEIELLEQRVAGVLPTIPRK